MRKWTGLVIATAVLAFAVSATAQPPGPGGPGRGGPGGPGGPPLDRLLQLTTEQQQALRTLREEERETTRPIAEQMRPLHGSLRQALESGNPDPTTVGNYMIQIHTLEQQIRSVHDSFQEKLVALLTPEQKEKFDAFQKEGPRGRGGRRGPGGAPFGPPPGR
jgi:Spy/CpxP family protein refolding chaperone